MAAAEVVRYIDPEATGANNGTSWGDAYTSLSALEASNLNLVTLGGGDGSWLHAYARSVGGTADATQANFSGWVTSATNYIHLEAASGQRATASGWKTDRYRLSTANASALLAGSGADHIIIDGFQIEVTSTNATGQAPFSFSAKAAGSYIYFRNCRLRGMASSSYAGATFSGSDADVTIYMWNCILEKHPNHAGTYIDGFYPTAGAVYVYNSIFYGFRNGIRDATGSTVRVYDCVSFNNTDDFTGTFHTVDYCASDDGDGTNAVSESGGGASWTSDFEDAANGDFRLKSGSALIGAGGKAGSGSFSTDMEGTSRGDAWDLGPYEYPSSGWTAQLGANITRTITMNW